MKIEWNAARTEATVTKGILWWRKAARVRRYCALNYFYVNSGRTVEWPLFVQLEESYSGKEETARLLERPLVEAVDWERTR